MQTIEKVIKNGYCVGCGVCSFASKYKIKMEFSKYGYHCADIKDASENDLSDVDNICPFSDSSIDETKLADSFFKNICDNKNKKIGYYDRLYAGRVLNSKIINLTSSGGLVSWLTMKLLSLKDIDGVIHVGPDDKEKTGKLFKYTISNSIEEILNKGKSKYYSVDLSEILNIVVGLEGKYAFIGVPCFVKAIRLLCENDKNANEKIKYCIGLVCGHLKSAGFGELLAWQMGINPESLISLDFRVKVPMMQSSSYGVAASSREGIRKTEIASNLYGSNWGYAQFQLKACDYCDDIFAETADISFGDAWLNKYIHIWQGTNIVISRNEYLSRILNEGCKSKEIVLEESTEEDISRSQEGNFRHRWQGLSYRLSKAKRNKVWVPKKRIIADSYSSSYFRKKIFKLRSLSAETSHRLFLKAKEKKNLSDYITKMKRITNKIDRIYKYIYILDEIVINRNLTVLFKKFFKHFRHLLIGNKE